MRLLIEIAVPVKPLNNGEQRILFTIDSWHSLEVNKKPFEKLKCPIPHCNSMRQGKGFELQRSMCGKHLEDRKRLVRAGFARYPIPPELSTAE